MKEGRMRAMVRWEERWQLQGHVVVVAVVAIVAAAVADASRLWPRWWWQRPSGGERGPAVPRSPDEVGVRLCLRCCLGCPQQ